jgi:alcohol dehydrogenase
MSEEGFGFQLETRIEFGPGRLASIGDEALLLAQKCVMLVTDPGLIAAGVAGRVEERLKLAGLDCVVFSGISSNPRDGECQEAARVAVDAGVELFVGLGGGSAIDTAKAAATLATNGGRVRDWEDPKRPQNPPLPLLAVPTTAGTGSEVTWVAVISDEDEHRKMTLLDPRIAPRVAILDPEITVSLPAQLTASTGMDALVHAIEAYTCKVANPISDALALQAIGLIGGALKTATTNASDLSARSDMLLGSLLAGVAFGNADVGAVHCLGESLGGLYDTPHGVACAVFLPFVLDFNCGANPEKHARVAAALGVDTSDLSADEGAAAASAAATSLMKTVGIPSLRDLQELSGKDMETLARLSDEHVCSPDNARSIGYDDYLRLVRQAYSA